MGLEKPRTFRRTPPEGLTGAYLRLPADVPPARRRTGVLLPVPTWSRQWPIVILTRAAPRTASASASGPNSAGRQAFAPGVEPEHPRTASPCAAFVPRNAGPGTATATPAGRQQASSAVVIGPANARAAGSGPPSGSRGGPVPSAASIHRNPAAGSAPDAARSAAPPSAPGTRGPETRANSMAAGIRKAGAKPAGRPAPGGGRPASTEGRACGAAAGLPLKAARPAIPAGRPGRRRSANYTLSGGPTAFAPDAGGRRPTAVLSVRLAPSWRPSAVGPSARTREAGNGTGSGAQRAVVRTAAYPVTGRHVVKRVQDDRTSAPTSSAASRCGIPVSR